jgi:type IV pilus assembly protein PilM
MMNHREERFKKGQKPIVGIDIGTSSVKMVQMKKNSKVARWGMEYIPEGMVNQGKIEVSTQLAEIIKRTAAKYKIKGNQCSVCLSGSELIVRELKLPEMGESQIMDNIRHEITSFLPLNHEEYCIDYKVLEYMPSQDETPGKLRIMVAAVPNNIVHTYINTLKKANLKVTYVDVVPNIAGKLAKWIMLNHGSKESLNNIGIIDFGARTTNIIILKDGNYFIHKTIANGGDYLTSHISEKLHIDYMEAEAFKRKANFFENNFQDNACQYVKNFIDYLITDVERTIEFYKNRNNQKGVDHIYLMGGGSLLKGLPNYMKEHLQVEVSPLADVMQQFKKGNDKEDRVAAFTQAIGATLREE